MYYRLCNVCQCSWVIFWSVQLYQMYYLMLFNGEKNKMVSLTEAEITVGQINSLKCGLVFQMHIIFSAHQPMELHFIVITLYYKISVYLIQCMSSIE